MANKPVTFTSAPLVKIKLDGQLIAYAVSMGYSISKQIQAPQILGEYAAPSLISTFYNPVRGQLRILKLAPKASRDKKVALANANPGLRADSRTGVTDNTSTPLTQIPDDIDGGILATSENLTNSFDPAKVILSSTFDIEIVRAYPSQDSTVIYNTLTTINDCRLETRNVQISMAQVVNESFSFVGTIAVNFSPNDASGTNADKILEDHYATDLVEPS